ncbi:hypothetical protein [Leifsonia sp. SIMBA_070]|uniref:PIN-like domain-containing protein n=1 Tax=Leifsonia sp. SIMBA_070 TaxID=3085810 RepID=UPI00397AE651
MSLEFFLDRGMGSRLVPQGLRARGWSITTMDERYGRDHSQGIEDARWIREASAEGKVVICKDRNVAKRPLEAQAIYYSEARVLVLASAQITGDEMLDHLLNNEEAIHRLARRTGPWVQAVYANRLGMIRLNFS